MRTPFSPALLLGVLATAAGAQSITIPNGLAAAEGSTSNAFPWNRFSATANLQQQMFYDSSHFTAQGVTGPVLITRLQWRANGSTLTWAGGTLAGCWVDMSTAAFDQALVSTNMASNHGPDLTRVFTGLVTHIGGTGNGAGVPGPTVVDMTLQAPFLYDPNAGDLCIDSFVPMNAWPSATGTSLDVHGTAPLASRVYNSTGAAAGTVTQNHGTVVTIDYVPAAGLYAGFSATPTSGATPLLVNFTDNSYTSDPGGITTWAWDFDGDTVIDSNVQNPSFTYTTCGTFSVSLTVTDATHPASTLTRTNLIVLDEITAGFTWAPLAPNVYQLTDTTTPAATAWDWDFNGDGITDSTLQDPVLVVSGCAQAVRLIATRNCRSSTVTRSFLNAPFNLAAAPFAATNGGSPGWIVFNDLNVTNPQGINVCGFDVNTGATAVGTPFTIDVYLTPGTYVGNDNNIAPWRLVGTASGIAQGNNVPSPTALARPLYLTPGTYGMGLQHLGASVRYTGTGTGGSPGVYSNADLTITTGAARSTLFAGGSFFSIRQWNGVVYYDTCAGSGSAGLGFFGPGCPNSNGQIPGQDTVSLPVLGGTAATTITNLPLNAAIQIVGFSNTTSPFGALPYDLSAFGLTGCNARVSPDATAFIAGAGGSASWSLSIPAIPSLACVQFYLQALVLDLPTVNTAGAVMSDACAGLVGN